MSSPIKINHPDPDSTQPALAIGGLASVAALVALALVRLLGIEPGLAAELGLVLAPMIVAALIRLKVYAPSTVHRLLAARADKYLTDRGGSR